MPEVFVDEARGFAMLHDGAATPGDCGICKIKGVGAVLVGWSVLVLPGKRQQKLGYSFVEFA